MIASSAHNGTHVTVLPDLLTECWNHHNHANGCGPTRGRIDGHRPEYPDP
jgi:hypothetical protein